MKVLFILSFFAGWVQGSDLIALTLPNERFEMPNEPIFVEVQYFVSPTQETPIFVEPAEKLWQIKDHLVLILGASGADIPLEIMARKHAWIQIVSGDEKVFLDIFPRRDGFSWEIDPENMATKLRKMMAGADAGLLSQIANYLAGNTPHLDLNANSYLVNGSTVINSSGAWVGPLPPEIETRLSLLEDKTAAISVDNDRFLISGMNVHITNGEAFTSTTNGLGNLILGLGNDFVGGLNRSGSHNLVIGDDHSYSSYGGIVSGLENTISAQGASVIGGYLNHGGGDQSVIVGGQNNQTVGNYSAISGGRDNSAEGYCGVVSGGRSNQSDGFYTVVSGGFENQSTGNLASVGGGRENMATASFSCVNGGYMNESHGIHATVSGGFNNQATGGTSTVGGGNNWTASNPNGWRAGTQVIGTKQKGNANQENKN